MAGGRWSDLVSHSQTCRSGLHRTSRPVLIKNAERRWCHPQRRAASEGLQERWELLVSEKGQTGSGVAVWGREMGAGGRGCGLASVVHIGGPACCDQTRLSIYGLNIYIYVPVSNKSAYGIFFI